MAPTPEPPPINIESEYCPKAVTQWYYLATLPSNRRECSLRRDLSLQAKKHLRFLGWRFWYIDKKDKWELRYTSPITGKNHISLARACKACIEEGGCNENPQGFQENNVVHLEYPSSQQKKDTRESEKRTRVCKKRKKDDHEDELEGGSSSTNGKRGKPARSIKTRKQEGEAQVSKSSQHHRGTLIPWLIENGAVGLDSVVFCRGSNGVVKKGKLLYNGIACDCCGKFFSPTRFEAHARCQKHRPNASIFLEDGRSLLDCKNKALSYQQNGFVKEEEIDDDCGYPNDSTCAVCRYGGELVLCDGCPSSFHLKCLGLTQVPDGDWFCPVCCCKICRRPRCRDDCAHNVGVNSILVCPQCERKYHFGCLKAPAPSYTKMEKEEDHVGNRNWFCSRDCEKIFFGLQELLGKNINVDADNVTWTLLKAVKRDSGGEEYLNLDGVVGGLSENERKLSVALDVLRGSFDPIIDAFSGRDLIADVVFSRGSELDRLNFRGFYTVVLEKDKEVVSAATVRILGKRVAEIPFVATRMQCRRQGMCNMLMNEIEKQLSYLGVERLVLPSSCSAINTWTKSFDFVKMKPSDKSKLLDHVFLNFEGTIMCHKPLLQETYV